MFESTDGRKVYHELRKAIDMFRRDPDYYLLVCGTELIKDEECPVRARSKLRVYVDYFPEICQADVENEAWTAVHECKSPKELEVRLGYLISQRRSVGATRTSGDWTCRPDMDVDAFGYESIARMASEGE